MPSETRGSLRPPPGLPNDRATRRFKPYPEYKNSGVEWLGDIPAHWSVKRLKHLCKIASGIAPPETFDRVLGDYPVFGSNGLIGYSDKFMTLRQTIVVGRVGASGSATVVPAQSWVSDNALLLLNLGPTALLPWLRLVVETMNLGEQAAKNAQPIITGTFLANQALGVPSEQEQRAIAAFLDRETARIDALVAKKEKLIALLQEKRAALITRAVTKGLDPNAPMKDSGIEWLGEIPAHWEVRRLRHIGDAIIGLTYDPSDVVVDGNDGTLVLRASNVSGGRIVLEDNVFVSRTIAADLRTRCGDILICSRSGSRALIGKCAKIGTEAEGLTFGAFMTIFRSPLNDYLFYAFNSTLFDYQSGTFLTSTMAFIPLTTLFSCGHNTLI